MTDVLYLLSWNVNGIRAVQKKGFLEWLSEAAPDILCLQETRAAEAQLPAALVHPAGYHSFWNAPLARKGYSGTALLTRLEPYDVEFGLGIEEFDQEGRTIIARYPTFTLINCYFPNGGRDLSRVPFKLAFSDAFLEKCESLRARGETVVFCGDVNTSHQELDLARPRRTKRTPASCRKSARGSTGLSRPGTWILSATFTRTCQTSTPGGPCRRRPASVTSVGGWTIFSSPVRHWTGWSTPSFCLGWPAAITARSAYACECRVFFSDFLLWCL